MTTSTTPGPLPAPHDFCPGSGTADYTNVMYYPLSANHVTQLFCASCGSVLVAEEEFVAAEVVIRDGIKTFTLKHRLTVPFHNNR